MGAVLKGVKLVQNPVKLTQEEEKESEPSSTPEKSRYEDLEDYKRQAEAIIENARKEAEAIIASARQQAEELLKDASQHLEEVKAEAAKYIDEYRKKGYQEGIENANLQAEEKLSEEIRVLREHVEKMVSSILNVKEDILYKGEEVVVKLLLLMLEKIVKKEVEIDKEFVLRNIESVLDRISEVSRIRLRLNPVDADTVVSAKLLNSKIDIVRDENVDRGGCIAETEFGDVDAQVSTQLKEIEDVMIATLREGRE